jgi:hypothetical protein
VTVAAVVRACCCQQPHTYQDVLLFGSLSAHTWHARGVLSAPASCPATNAACCFSFHTCLLPHPAASPC